MFGNRGIYHKGWTAVTKHRTPGLPYGESPGFRRYIWELYDTTKDWSQAKDLSKEMPEKLQRAAAPLAHRSRALQGCALDDRMMEKMNPDTAGRPVLIKGKTQLLSVAWGA